MNHQCNRPSHVLNAIIQMGTEIDSVCISSPSFQTFSRFPILYGLFRTSVLLALTDPRNAIDVTKIYNSGLFRSEKDHKAVFSYFFFTGLSLINSYLLKFDVLERLKLNNKF